MKKLLLLSIVGFLTWTLTSQLKDFSNSPLVDFAVADRFQSEVESVGKTDSTPSDERGSRPTNQLSPPTHSRQWESTEWINADWINNGWNRDSSSSSSSSWDDWDDWDWSWNQLDQPYQPRPPHRPAADLKRVKSNEDADSAEAAVSQLSQPSQLSPLNTEAEADSVNSTDSSTTPLNSTDSSTTPLNSTDASTAVDSSEVSVASAPGQSTDPPTGVKPTATDVFIADNKADGSASETDLFDSTQPISGNFSERN